MKKRITLLTTCLLMCVGTAMAEVNIIPKPTSVVEHEGSFLLKDGMTIGYSDASLEPAATYLQGLLTQSTGLSFKTKAGKGKIQLSIVLPDESNEDFRMEVKAYPGLSIGGDEVNRRRWSECEECQKRTKSEGLKDVSELQAWFTKKMEKYFNAHGRRILGWDEILEGGLSKTATVHWWRGDHPDVTQKSTAMGNEVVLCPFTFLYFDYAQDDNTLRHIYDGDIVPVDLTAEQLKLIKGMQANIWCERIPTEARMEWMVFPRALALAEKAWTPRNKQNWDDFLPRLKAHLKRLEAMGIQYRPLQTKRP